MAVMILDMKVSFLSMHNLETESLKKEPIHSVSFWKRNPRCYSKNHGRPTSIYITELMSVWECIYVGKYHFSICCRMRSINWFTDNFLTMKGTSDWMGKESQFSYQRHDKLSLRTGNSQSLCMMYALLLTLHISVGGVNKLQYVIF